MAYFPKIGPFYDPGNEHEFYGEQDGRLRLRNLRERRDSGNGESIRESRNGNRRSKVGWSDLVQDQTNIFYTEPNNRQGDSVGSSQNGAKLELNNNHSRQGSSQSDSIDSPRQFIDGRLGRNFERQGSSDSRHSVLSNRSVSSVERVHHNIDHPGNVNANPHHQDRSAFDRQDKQRLSDPSYASFSKYLDSNTSSPLTSQRQHLKTDQRNSGSISGGGAQSGKRKSVLLVPNTKAIDDVTNYTGVELCEKLFGIKLCNYKQRPQQTPNGSSIEQVLRERKVIVQGVVADSQADICGQIHRGDMLVGLNDIDVTWVNIEDLLRQLAQSDQVKLTFQVPLVIGPKQATPPVTPTRSTPPLPPHVPHVVSTHNPPPVPPHIPRRIPLEPPPPPRPPPPMGSKALTSHDIVTRTTGESLTSILESLRRYMFAVIYLTFAGQSEESKEDVVYQFPFGDNKLIETRGLFHTLSALPPDVTSNCPKLTSVQYRGSCINVAYWRHERDVLLMCLPEARVSSYCLLHVLSNVLRVVKVLYGSVVRVFQDRELHSNLDQLLCLTLYRILLTGVTPQTLPPCSPLEPMVLDSMSGVRWLHLLHDDKILCDEILSEYEAQDFNELEEVIPDERRQFGVVGSCLYYKDYLICSHLRPPDLQDVHLFLLHHCVLHLVNREPVEDLVIWQEVYPTHLCHTERPDVPGYREPTGRWFLLVTGVRHFLHCTLFETGSYASQNTGAKQADRFCVDQSRASLSQLYGDDTDIEEQCNERLFSEKMRPPLKSISSDRQLNRQTSQTSEGSLLKSPLSKLEGSPKYDESRHSPDASTLVRRQGSRVSYGSNDSNGSSNSLGLNKGVSPNKKGSVYDVSTLNKSLSERDRQSCVLKLSRGCHNLLLHFAHFDQFEGVYVCPRPGELANVRGPTHEHMLFNFYACCLKIRNMFEQIIRKKRHTGPGSPHGQLEEAVMFTCHVGGQQDPKKPPSVFIYWVIGRLSPDNREMFVCLEDGAPQSMLELAFSYNFGVT